MQDLNERIQQLKTSLSIDQKRDQIKELEAEVNAVGFWDNPEVASKTSRKLSELQKIVAEWQNLAELIEAADDDDRPMLEEELDKLEQLTYFNGPHDDAAAILSIHAGTGGIDAQDWAMMLLRMYTRYAENQKWSVGTLDYTVGEEAGIKRATIKTSGLNAYGYLKGEAGVHRLVRLSPFNANNLRQTSFALVEVLPEISKNELVIPDSDLKIDVYRASGHGGQGVNTTDSAVRITHLPTGIVVTCQNERSQMQNKETAMGILQSRLLVLMEKDHIDELSKLKPNVQGSWGNQIRSYVLQPYTMVKDHRTEAETSNVEAVLSGDLDLFIQAELKVMQHVA